MIQIAAAQSATLNDIMFEHQAKEDGVAGLKIYLDMDVKNLKGKTGMVAIYFYDSEHNPLPDRNGKYRTTSGQVAHSRTFTPSYDSSHYKNFTLFMPNDELDYLSTQGRSETIYCQIEVSQNSRLLASSKSQPMHISVVNSPYDTPPSPCVFCFGSGFCNICKGGGTVVTGLYNKQFFTCGKCQGSGKCSHCKGSGVGHVPPYSCRILPIDYQPPKSASSPSGTYMPGYGVTEPTMPINDPPERHQCYNCKGTGRAIVRYFTADSDGKTWCSECQDWMYNFNAHVHGSCPECHGLGYYIVK